RLGRQRVGQPGLAAVGSLVGRRERVSVGAGRHPGMQLVAGLAQAASPAAAAAAPAPAPLGLALGLGLPGHRAAELPIILRLGLLMVGGRRHIVLGLGDGAIVSVPGLALMWLRVGGRRMGVIASILTAS